MRQTSTGTAPTTSIQKNTQTATPKPPVEAPQPRSTAPDHEAIARLAYQFWEERGRPEGSSYEDWLRAEKELLKSAS